MIRGNGGGVKSNLISRKVKEMEENLQAEYIEKMEECIRNDDTEGAHYDADGLLCELLRKLGYNELVDKYIEVDKWYA